MGNPPCGTCKIPQRASYDVKLFIDEAEWLKLKEPMFTIEKVADNKVERISPFLDLLPWNANALNLLKIKNGNLRLVIEDNTGDGYLSKYQDTYLAIPSVKSRGDFYNKKNSEILDIKIPLRIEVRKFIGSKEIRVEENEVRALFEFGDPAENLDNIKGVKREPTPRTGKEFVKKFNEKVKNSQGIKDDNCVSVFAEKNFDSNCRTLNNPISASRILYRKSEQQNAFINLLPSSTSSNKAQLRITASKDRSQLKGSAVFFFGPPFIPGDNYILKVTLTDSNGNPLLSKQEETPIITIWKKISIHMIVYQESVSYGTLKWQEIKRVYEDAFILVEEPLPEHVIKIPTKDWMGYLEKFIYKKYSTPKWDIYKKTEYKKEHEADFSNFSFPQKHENIEGSEHLTPPNENRGTGGWFTALEATVKLMMMIIKEKLAKHGGNVTFSDFGDPLKGKRIGFCILLCKPPSPVSTFGGFFAGGKLFNINDGKNGDLTLHFVHEMGHTLFLNHGLTQVARIAWGDLYENCIIIKKLQGNNSGGNDSGPYYSEHDSEDMVSCVMSYQNNYYDGEGKKLAKTKYPVDWHFCGVCLLRLRFYDPIRMAAEPLSLFRELNYSNLKNQNKANRNPLKIAVKSWSDLTSAYPRLTLSLKSTVTIVEGGSKHLFALYPREAVRNNDGYCFKDISFFADPKSKINGGLDRGKWESSQPRVADVELKDSNGYFCSFLKAKEIGTTIIKFRLNASSKIFFLSDPLKVKVIPKMKFKASATPASATVTIGQNATFTASASGGIRPYNYQWYEGTSPMVAHDILTVDTSTVGTYTYHCKVTDAAENTATTNTVTLTVNPRTQQSK